ncbi:amino acid ABC transporter ATP-binding protein [Oecophyllibacter saccharovorans]|uniref:amino acid ABC transporter ATP-binding protein n=1 Tax=Oecophyllibacter saccharovorans TaxID=2558360 RepID=UPI001143EDCC|nr:amino acid ABC transporter ATP-binding protein [Oecophyllibacter saccharovorans]QDH15456.1 amino acid ABC transporter ATP-binding protein [Oecophyllibacter saccharovorans]
MTELSDLVLQAENIRKNLGGNEILHGLSLDVERGELVSIIGPSGCGKSTFLRCLNFLEHPDSGKVRVEDVSLEGTVHWHARQEAQAHKLRAHVGMVFQDFNLFPHRTVLENVMMAPMHVKNMPREQAQEIATEFLNKVGLGKVMDRHPDRLSGGQKQRAAIARALAMKPSVMLYDEPTSALDPELSEEVLEVMRALDREGMTQIVVTHDMRFARAASDRVLYLEGGEIVESGSPEKIFASPEDPRTRRFLRTLLA